MERGRSRRKRADGGRDERNLLDTVTKGEWTPLPKRFPYFTVNTIQWTQVT